MEEKERKFYSVFEEKLKNIKLHSVSRGLVESLLEEGVENNILKGFYEPELSEDEQFSLSIKYATIFSRTLEAYNEKMADSK